MVEEEASGTAGEAVMETTVSYLPTDMEFVSNILSQDSYKSEMDVDAMRAKNNRRRAKNNLKRASSVNSTLSMASRASAGAAADFTPLVEHDLIVEKMHIHHGQKAQNPVNNMRFFPKDANPQKDIAKQIDESTYETSMSRVYEELAVRVFCRTDEKVAHARKVFERWCSEMNTVKPYPNMSQGLLHSSALDAVSEVEDDDEEQEEEDEGEEATLEEANEDEELLTEEDGLDEGEGEEVDKLFP